MLVYSTTINKVRKKMRLIANEIMRQEMHLNLPTSTSVSFGPFMVHLDFALFENDNKILAYYNHDQRLIAFNLIWLTQLHPANFKDVMRHELAHFVYNEQQELQARQVYPFLGYTAQGDHDAAFKAFCDKFWPGQNIGAAYIELMPHACGSTEQHLLAAKVLEKIKKLWALAESSNVHEAALAAAKANELLLRHHLENLKCNDLQDEELTYQHTIFATKQQRINAKLNVIASIARLFYVAPIFTSSSNGIALTAVGAYHNLQVAEYVAHFLDRELDRLWALSSHRGITARNSFYYGVAEGFESKIKAVQQTVASSKELIKLEEDLAKKVKQVFPRTRSRTTSARINAAAKSDGRQAGKNLSINPALRKGPSSSSAPRLLSY